MTDIVTLLTAERSLTAQLIAIAGFVACFAGVGLWIVGRNVWRALAARPVIEDQPEHWADDCPWPLARHGSDAITSAGAGGVESLAAEQLFSHGEQQ